MQTGTVLIDHGNSEDDASLVAEPDVGYASSPRSVAVFLDVANFHVAASRAGVKFSPWDVIQVASGFGRVVVRRAYSAIAVGNPVPIGLLDSVNAGFDPIVRPLTSASLASKDADCLMIADIVDFACTHDAEIFVVASGDADMTPGVRIAQKRGKQVIVVAWDGTCARALQRVADGVKILRPGIGSLP